jgi:hypothetical protein
MCLDLIVSDDSAVANALGERLSGRLVWTWPPEPCNDPGMARGGTLHYVGDSLTALVPESVERLTHSLMRDICQTGRDVMFDTARASTPIGRTGAVANSWLAEPIEHHGERYETKIRNDHWLAHLLNYGTQAHEIRPKVRRADLTPLGPRAGAHVSGIHPRHMVEHAVDVAAATLDPLTYSARERWKRDSEQAIQRAKFEQRVID